MINRKYKSAWMTAVASFIVWVTSLAQGQSQNAWVADNTLHIGNVHQGVLVERTFTVQNPGRSNATIRVVALSHPGMKIRSPHDLQPGAQGQIVISWDTHLVQGDMTAQALLSFNDKETVLLSLSANVIPPIEILPYSAAFISGFRDENATTTLEVINNDSPPLNISSIERENPQSVKTYNATLKTITPGRKYELSIELKATAHGGRSRDVLLLHTDHPRFPVIRVPVNLFVKEDVYINPESVDFGQITSESWNPETFLLNSRRRPIKVLSVKSDPPFLKVTGYGTDAATAHEFRVEIEGEPSAGAFVGSIHIATDDPSFPNIDAPVQGEVLK